MSFEEFKTAFINELHEYFETELKVNAKITESNIPKINKTKPGITVKFDSAIEDSSFESARIFYLDDLYEANQNGLDMESLVKTTVKNLSDDNFSVDIPELSLENAKDHLTLVLVNTAKNEKLLELVPHREILDGELSIIPRWNITEEASFLFRNEMLDKLNISEVELFEICTKNVDKLDFRFTSMKDYMTEMFERNGIDIMEEELNSMPCDMYLATTQQFLYGAKILLSDKMMDKIHKKLGDFIVLPSSIHEILCIPNNEEIDKTYLYDLVESVNTTALSPSEYLSDVVMFYDGEALSRF